MSEYAKYTKRELVDLLETQEEMVDALREENRRQVPADEITHLYHELRVHQEELEVQNQELRLMTEAIEQSRHRYATLYDFAPAAFVSLDDKGVIHDINLTAATFLRNDRSVLIGKPFSVFLKEGQRHALYDHLKQTLASGRKHTVDLALDLRMNHPVYVQFDSLAIKDELHNKTLAWTCVSDITTRKLAENRLHASETNLSAVIENTEDAIWSIDQRYHVVAFNSAFNALRKHLAQAAGSGSLAESVAPSHLQFNYEWKALYDRALSGEHFTIEKDYRLGEDVHCFEFSLNPIRRGADTSGVTVFAKDVTDRKNLETELRNATERAEAVIKSKSNFFAHVSHEIRTPLSAILSYAALIREDEGSSESANFAEIIERNTQKILSSVTNILALSRMDWDGFSLKREVVDVVPIVAKQAELFSAIALKRDTDVVYHISEDQPSFNILGDQNSIEQVLSNLLSNAVKFTNDGMIEISLSGDDEHVRIQVQDNGPGISADFLPYLFQEYKQEGTHGVGGTGLGLAIAKRLVELMQGEISVESEVGKGTTFTIVFPTAQPVAIPQIAKSANRPA
jgi:PAS domain S-box-containing protein